MANGAVHLAPGAIRVGIGGWSYAPWRGTFYPPGLPQARELDYAANRLGAIEINATFYKRQSPDSWRRWADATPPGFVFSVKGSRFCTNRKVLASAGEAIEGFFAQGLTALGEKLGPILWQFAATKRFEHDDFAAFLKLLPTERDGVPLRHALEVRHESFLDMRYPELAEAHGCATVVLDPDPICIPRTGSFVYARLQDMREEEAAGYDPTALDNWAAQARIWAGEGHVYLFAINGAKLRAPAAAQALIARLPR